MIFLRTAALCVSILAFLVRQPAEGDTYDCGPFCPHMNETPFTSCITLCPEGERIFDPFLRREGRFRNGTPCWIDGNRNGEIGMCCGGDCYPNKTCKSKMWKCALEDAIWIAVSHRTSTMNISVLN
uniref:Putative secreted protein n=1 Tax=Amblyomma americanum TaxID=6943 RepID=A0A0C9S495_AMBAM